MCRGDRPYNIIVHEAPNAVFLDRLGRAARRCGRRSMHHEAGVRWRCPCRCLQVELGNVPTGGQRDGVAGMRKLEKEGEGGAGENPRNRLTPRMLRNAQRLLALRNSFCTPAAFLYCWCRKLFSSHGAFLYCWRSNLFLLPSALSATRGH